MAAREHNVTNSSSIQGPGRILYEYFPINIVSVLSNSFIIFLCFKSPELKQQNHAKYFIANTAFLDLCFAISALTQAVIYSTFYIFNMPISLLICTTFHISGTCLATGAVLSCLATTVCRFRELQLNRHCSKRLITLLVIYPYLTLIPYLLNHWILADDSKTVNYNKFCVISYSTQFSTALSLPLLFWPLASFAAQMILSLKLYKHLKWHFKNVSANLQTNRSEVERLRTERSILKAVLIQGLAPIVLSAPGLIGVWIRRFFHDHSIHAAMFNGRIGWSNIAIGVYFLNPLVDSWAVLYVMIPYARARRKLMEKLWRTVRSLLCHRQNTAVPCWPKQCQCEWWTGTSQSQKIHTLCDNSVRAKWMSRSDYCLNTLYSSWERNHECPPPKKFKILRNNLLTFRGWWTNEQHICEETASLNGAYQMDNFGNSGFRWLIYSRDGGSEWIYPEKSEMKLRKTLAVGDQNPAQLAGIFDPKITDNNDVLVKLLNETAI